jgi:hypothetical protein
MKERTGAAFWRTGHGTLTQKKKRRARHYPHLPSQDVDSGCDVGFRVHLKSGQNSSAGKMP